MNTRPVPTRSREIGFCCFGGCTPDRQSRRRRPAGAPSNECNSRSRSRRRPAAQAPIPSWTYAPQAPIPSRPDARSGTDARHLRRDAHVPNPICRRGAESRTDNFEGSRDSGTGRVGGYRRRREHRVASSNDRSTHSRRHWSRGVSATEGSSSIGLGMAFVLRRAVTNGFASSSHMKSHASRCRSCRFPQRGESPISCYSDDCQTEHRRPDTTLNGYSISTAAVAARGNGPAQKGVRGYSAPYRKCRAKRHSQLFLGLHTTCEAFDRASSP